MDPGVDFVLRTDTADRAIGAVLAQRQIWKGSMLERPLGFFTHTQMCRIRGVSSRNVDGSLNR
jgi:hypothetical protein